MNREEFLALDAADAAKVLNELIAEGKTQEEAEAVYELTAEDKRILNIFWVKDKYLARSWGGYTSTKKTGNEKGSSKNGFTQGKTNGGGYTM